MWSSPQETPLLPEKALHLWRIDLNIPPLIEMKLRNFLSSDEKAKARAFKFLKDQRHYVASRGYLRVLLGKYLKKPPESLEFQYSEYGKPALKPKHTLEFNLSHAGGKALIGVIQGPPIGVDLEWLDRNIDLPLVARHSFAPKEVATLFGLPKGQQRLAFFRCWTRKEAFIKARGDGLSLPLDQFEVTLTPHEKPQLISTYWDPEEPKRWTLREVIPGKNFVGAWACRGEVHAVSYFELSPGMVEQGKIGNSAINMEGNI